jgi:hypothetical protein
MAATFSPEVDSKSRFTTQDIAGSCSENQAQNNLGA